MNALNRGHEYILYKIICMIRNHEKLTYTDIGYICMIRAKLDIMDVVKADETQCGIMCDIAGKLFYIDKYIKGEY